MTDKPHPDYADLIAAMADADKRPIWRHVMCLDRRLVGNVRKAREILDRAVELQETGEAQPRKKLGHLSVVEKARLALTAAEKERDESSIVFVLSPLTADEQEAALAAAGVTDTTASWKAYRAILAASWRSTETLDGDPLPWIDRDHYTRALQALGIPEILGAHTGLVSVVIDPDFQ